MPTTNADYGPLPPGLISKPPRPAKPARRACTFLAFVHGLSLTPACLPGVCVADDVWIHVNARALAEAAATATFHGMSLAAGAAELRKQAALNLLSR